MTASFFLSLIALLLVAGLAIDVGALQLRQRRAQTAADAAALGAAYENARGNSDWVSAGQADAGLNGFTNGSNGVVVAIVSPPTAGNYSGITSDTQATVTQTALTSFMALVHSPYATVQARAVAQAASSPNCISTLDASMSRSLMLSGTINASCAAFVNSSSSSALNLDGGSSLTTTSTNIVGGYTNSGYISSSPTTGVSAQTDPLASLTQPSFSSCTYTNTQVNSSTGARTLSPGTYCGGITVSGANLTLQPGLYIITGGINWNSSSTVTGAGVTLFFTTGGGSGYGQVVISGGVTVNLSAPLNSSSGGIPGILMWGDRNWDSTSQNVNFNGGSVSKMEGYLYFPTTGMIVSTGTLSSGSGNYLDIIADNLTVNGGATLTLPTPNYAQVSGGNPVKSGVSLAE